MASQFFEYVFEPALADQNSIFYQANFHRFIAGIVYAHWTGRDRPTEQLVEGFAAMMRALDGSKFEPAAGELVSFDDRRIMDQIAVFALLHRRSIEDELNVIYGDGHTPNWVVDLSTTSLFQILSEFGAKYTALEVFCDASKPLLANRDIFDHMVNRPEMPMRHSVWGDRPFGFNLASEPRFLDSASAPGIQIADVVAATAGFIFQNRRDPQAGAWLPYLDGALVNCLMPDLAYASPDIRNMQVWSWSRGKRPSSAHLRSMGPVCFVTSCCGNLKAVGVLSRTPGSPCSTGRWLLVRTSLMADAA